ncbi:hypothetical protein DRE_04889 [Drechslerella stenobrocha 248]|uniref:Uncharacterized protein n=1 Tax=Drechslerella stenobrocha 248 TaxID=1043628 RepID=W7I075_9PEZI|nr:hypothetical protein DRE_04889 [Drechslerella stenobrocha 248]
MNNNKNNGVRQGITGVTSTVGNLTGGLLDTVGSTVGTLGRGLGGTINSTTGTRVAGDSLAGLTNGVEGGVRTVARGVEDAGKAPGK